jgi:signal transduction histidine kinase
MSAPSQPFLKKARRSRPLRALLLRLVFIPSASIATILFFFSIFQGYTLVNEIFKEQHAQISSLSQLTDQYIDETSRLMVTLGHMLGSEAGQEHRQQMLDIIHENYPRFDAFYYIAPNGQVILESGTPFSLKGLDMSGESYFQAATTSRQTYISEIFISLSTEKVTVTAAAPIIEDGEITGVLVGELDLTYLQKIIENVNTLPESKTFIVDNGGNLVAYPDPNWVQEQRNLQTLPIIQSLHGNDNSIVYFDENQQTYVIGSAARTTHGWVIVADQPFATAMSSLIVLAIFSIIIIALSVIVILWTQAYSRHAITRPIAVLARYADDLAEGNYLPELTQPDMPIDELKSLSQSFIAMARAVRQRTIELQQANTELQVQIQERKQAEKAVRELNADLEERVKARTAELEAAVTEIEKSSYTISHDLRAPLRAIHGYISILIDEDGKNLSSNGLNYLEKVRENALAMGTLVDNLLAFLRLYRVMPNKQPLDMESLIQHSFKGMLSHEKPDRRIEFTFDHMPSCIADPQMILQALDALFSNALKFTRTREITQIHAGVTTQGNKTVYYIRDNGIGFDMRYASKLFGIFQHLHSPGQTDAEGAGTGLAFANRIINKHGGEIWAESELDKGATFYFTIE